MVTVGPLKFSGSSTTRSLLDDHHDHQYYCKLHSNRHVALTNNGAKSSVYNNSSNGRTISSPSNTTSHMLDYERRRLKNLSSQLSLSSPTSPAMFRRREKNPDLPSLAVEKRLFLTPKLCRKAVVTNNLGQQPDDQQRQQTNGNCSPKVNSNEFGSTTSCRLVKAAARSVMADKDCNNNNNNHALINDQGVISKRVLMNNTVVNSSSSVKQKSSISSNSRDTSIESIIPKYKSYSCYKAKSSVLNSGQLSTNGISSSGISTTNSDGPLKRSYNPRLSIKTNKFILSDKNEVKKSSVVIPKSATSSSSSSDNGSSMLMNHHQSRSSFRALANVTKSNIELKPNHIENEPGFFNRDQSNESLYIDFSKKLSRSPSSSQHCSTRRQAALTSDKENELCVVYKFEVLRKSSNNNETMKRAMEASQPSVLYVSCASWVPKCNNKFSLRERRLLEESKAISKKR